MSALIERLIARTHSDIRRGVPFHIGLKHFTDLIQTTLKEMDLKIKQFEEKDRKRKP